MRKVDGIKSVLLLNDLKFKWRLKSLNISQYKTKGGTSGD